MTTKQLTAAQKKAAAKAEAEAQAAEKAKTEAIADAAEQSPAAGTEQAPTSADAAEHDQLGTDAAQTQTDSAGAKQDQVDTGTDQEKLNSTSVEKVEANGSKLTPLQLRVKNKGPRSMCHVTHALIEANSETVITYPSIQEKDLAKGNFAQINKLKGSKRFEVEG